MSLIPESLPGSGMKKPLRLLRRPDGQPPIYNNKKLEAQRLYYERNPHHQSPLLRTERGPVKERLGVKQFRLKRNVMPLGTNTSSILPRKKLFRAQGSMNQNNPGKFRRSKLSHIYSAQDRLERIRRQQRNNAPIKLRRGNSSLTVQVKNTHFLAGENGTAFTYQGFQKFKMVLDPEIQEEIAEIQIENMSRSTEPLSPLTKITPVMTQVPLSTRFTLLSS